MTLQVTQILSLQDDDDIRSLFYRISFGAREDSLNLCRVKMMQRHCGGWKITIHLFRTIDIYISGLLAVILVD